MPESIITIAELDAITTAPDSSFIPIDNGTTTNKITVENFNATSTASAASKALVSEGYAVGKQNGIDVDSSSIYYENNAKYYKEQAASAATSAADSYSGVLLNTSAAELAASNAEGSAGAASSSATQAANSQSAAASSAAAASGSATAAGNSATRAESAANAAIAAAASAAGDVPIVTAYAEAAANNAKLSESYAKGGTNTRTGEDTDNAEYYMEQALQYAGDAATQAESASGMATESEGYAINARSWATGDTSTRPNEGTTNAQYYCTQANDAAISAQLYAGQAEAWGSHLPYIGANGNWYVWDTTTSAYVDSEVDASIDVSVGTTTTLPAGSNASVTNSGTGAAPVLNFSIPKGDQGDPGTDGTDGEDGVSPEVTITPISGGTQVTITDADHPSGQSFNILNGTGAGDMLSSTYDSTSAVATAGGIADYVSSAISGKMATSTYDSNSAVATAGGIASFVNGKPDGTTITTNSQGKFTTNNYRITGVRNVLDYGLVADGTTDNSAAFTAMLASIHTGETVYFPLGKYMFRSPITVLKTAISMVGEVESTHYATPAHRTAVLPTLIYDGDANTTFLSGGEDNWYMELNNLHFVCPNGYAVDYNSAPFTSVPYDLLTYVATKDLINGVSCVNGGPDVTNCSFLGFSGYAVKLGVSNVIRKCSFSQNRTGIETMYDTMIQECFFRGNKLAISALPHSTTSQHPFTTLNVSDTWIEQGETAIQLDAESSMLMTSNLWASMFDRAAIIATGALEYSRLDGSITRPGMRWAGMADSARTKALAKETDGIVAKSFKNCEMNISVRRRNIGKGNNSSAECPSRAFTAVGNLEETGGGKIESCSIIDRVIEYARLIDTNMVTNITNSCICTSDIPFPVDATKADKVSSATNGNFAGLDSNGNLTDSGSKASDFAAASHSHAWGDVTSKPFSTVSSGLTVTSDALTADVQSVTVGNTGTASDTAVSYQRVGVNGSYTEIKGTKYMEQTITLSTSASVTATFTNAAILATSAIEVFAGRSGGDVSGSKNAFPFESIYTTAGSCAVTFPKEDSAISLKVRIYIR